ncbi:hypothetical protein Bca101_062218 [Brassica carinata]
MDVTVSSQVFPSQGLQTKLRWGAPKRKVKFVDGPQLDLDYMLMKIGCWSGVACGPSKLLECSHSTFQRVNEATTHVHMFSVLPLSSTKFSLVEWSILRSGRRTLFCGVVVSFSKSTHSQLFEKNARGIFFDDVVKFKFKVVWDVLHSNEVSYESHHSQHVTQGICNKRWRTTAGARQEKRLGGRGLLLL